MIATNSPGSIAIEVAAEDLLLADLHGDVLGVEPQRAAVVAARRSGCRRRRAGTARSPISAPGSSEPRARRARRSTRVPLREPRSRSSSVAVARADLGVEAGDVGVVEDDVVRRVAADRQRPRAEVDHRRTGSRRCGRPAEPGPLAGDVAKRLAADLDRVAAVEPPRLALEELAVQQRSGAGAGIGQIVAAVARADHGMTPGDVAGIDDDVAGRIGADRDAGAADRHPPSLVKDLGGERRLLSGRRRRLHRRRRSLLLDRRRDGLRLRREGHGRHLGDGIAGCRAVGASDLEGGVTGGDDVAGSELARGAGLERDAVDGRAVRRLQVLDQQTAVGSEQEPRVTA